MHISVPRNVFIHSFGGAIFTDVFHDDGLDAASEPCRYVKKEGLEIFDIRAVAGCALCDLRLLTCQILNQD